MFIKIKLEPKTEIIEGTKLKTPSYFEIEDKSTIGEVKLQIQNFIDVPANRQQIRTVTKTLGDEIILADIDELTKHDSSTVMLYINGADGFDEEEPTFLCFLHFYSANEAAVQQDYEKRSSDADYLAKYEPSSVTSTITLVEDTEAGQVHDFLESNSSSSSSGTSSQSDTDSDNSGSKTLTNQPLVDSRKRQLDAEQNEAKHKRVKRYTVIPKIPSNISTYLEEFPKYSNESAVADGQDSAELVQPSATDTATTTSIACSSTHPSPTNSIQQLGDQKQANSPNTTTHDEEPCAVVMPEQREFIVILSNINADKKIETKDCIELFAAFFDIFKTSENIGDLKFYEPILCKGLLWMACEDERTSAWTLAKSNIISDTHESHKFIDYFKLKRCLTVIPQVAKARNLLDVFALIQQQNPGIKTAQWTVLDHRVIANESDEFFEKRVCRVCSNEVLFLRIDDDSLYSLKEHNLKLNYCFWKIIFEINE